MNERYLVEKKGRPDPEIVYLERVLATRRLTIARPQRMARWRRRAGALAAAAAVVLLAGGWALEGLWPGGAAGGPATAPASGGMPVSAPEALVAAEVVPEAVAGSAAPSLVEENSLSKPAAATLGQ